MNTRIFIEDNQSRITRYTTNFVDVTESDLGVQATAPAIKKGNSLIISDAWYMVKTKDGNTLPGIYEIQAIEAKGKLKYITASKK